MNKIEVSDDLEDLRRLVELVDLSDEELANMHDKLNSLKLNFVVRKNIEDLRNAYETGDHEFCDEVTKQLQRKFGSYYDNLLNAWMETDAFIQANNVESPDNDLMKPFNGLQDYLLTELGYSLGVINYIKGVKKKYYIIEEF